jgi:hypothetical protein
MEMSKIRGCSMFTCAYNRDDMCHTAGITVGPHAECFTYVHASPLAGFPELKGIIGACQASNCKFNKNLECQAPAVDVAEHDRHADCDTFEPVKREPVPSQQLYGSA